MVQKGIDTGATYDDSAELFHGALKNIMGTRLDVLVIGQTRWESFGIWNEIVPELRRLDTVFNRFDEASETSMINRNAAEETVRVSDEMWEILQSCKDYHARTLGLFDITLSDFSAVITDGDTRTVRFLNHDILLDFGGYAKGFALSRIKDILLKAEVKHAFVDFGNSSILAMGHHPYGESWKVSIQNPYQSDVIVAEASLKDQVLTISGNTPNYNNHIVRPDDGSAQQERKVVSVTSEDPLDGEVLSTVFMIANEEEKLKIKRNFKTQNIAEYLV